ncbi:TPA: hypothetical protein ACS773_002144 [Providencia alcalifaciens]
MTIDSLNNDQKELITNVVMQAGISFDPHMKGHSLHRLFGEVHEVVFGISHVSGLNIVCGTTFDNQAYESTVELELMIKGILQFAASQPDYHVNKAAKEYVESLRSLHEARS